MVLWLLALRAIGTSRFSNARMPVVGAVAWVLCVHDAAMYC